MSLVLCHIYCLVSIASAADEDSEKDITIMECKDIKYVDAQRVEAHYDWKELRLVGIAEDDKPFIIARTKPKEDPFNGAGTAYYSTCKGNTINLSIKAPFREYSVTQTFKWDGESLKQTKTTTKDYSQDLIDSALNKALKGDLAGAKSDFADVMYPRNYLGCDTIKDFLAANHKASFSIQKKEGFKRAATALENTFELMVEADYESGNSDSPISTPIPDRWMEIFKKCELSKSEYVSALNDYGFFLQQSGQNDKATNILLLVVSADPKRTVAYLNLADAYWGLGKKQEAIDNYKRYKKLMINSKKADKVPDRVKGRLKANE